MSESQNLEIPGHVTLASGNGGLSKVLIETAWSSAEIYLHGAHVTRFQKKDEVPLLFMSAASEFTPDKPIRGGVPLIFPWFGPREGFPAHGYARTTSWELRETRLLDDGSVTLTLVLPVAEFHQVEYLVTVAETLTMELIVRNISTQATVIETCLHTYFQISAIDAISITGLAGTTYLDTVTNSTHTETSAPIRIAGEVDRLYLDTTATVEIEDPGFGRIIRIEKLGSDSTVVWNPWIEKSRRMVDFGDDEYLQMVCVESGNIAKNRITLSPGEVVALKAVVSSAALV
ncbi:MAG TPA: D-hexose-6-phosphate mutarotase [Luteolibacter sp.]